MRGVIIVFQKCSSNIKTGRVNENTVDLGNLSAPVSENQEHEILVFKNSLSFLIAFPVLFVCLFLNVLHKK